MSFRQRASRALSFSRIAALLASAHTGAHAQEGLRPIRGPITPGFWEENAMWAVPSLVVGGLLLLLLIRWIWKRARAEKTLSPRETYQRETDAIQKLIADGHTEEVPARLSRVLREYIEAATGIHAPEQTTEEFLAEVLPGATSPPPSDGGPPPPFEELRPFLKMIDEAKFARRALQAEDCRDLLERADRFVAANEERKNRA